jgi:hypothetical protein
VIKSRKKWVEHAAPMGDTRNAYKILVGKPEGKNHLEYLCIEGRIILELILGLQGGKVWIG